MDIPIPVTLPNNLTICKMSAESKHITPYRLYAVVLVVLLFLTTITIIAATLDAGAFGVTLALVIASVKVILVLIYFMHLKFDHLIFKIFAAMVFFLLALVIAITFIDYLFR